MPTLRNLVLLCLVSAQPLFSQVTPPVTTTNLLDLTLSPPQSNATNLVFLISGSTNAISVTINNRDVFTNITVSAAYTNFVSTNRTAFRDAGQPPDQTADDGTFTGNVIAPLTRIVTTNMFIYLTVVGEDFTFINPDPSITNAALVTNQFVVSYLVLPRPENDNLTNAFKIEASGGLILSTNDFASMEPGEPQHARVAGVDSSVWWTWSPSVNTRVLMDLAGSTFPPVLAVYSGQALPDLKLVAASTNDLQNGIPPNVVFDAVKGVTYRIAVASHNNKTNFAGDVRLRVAPGAVPDNRPPTVSILSPLNGLLVSTEQLVVSGTAREMFITDSGVSNVVLQVNNGAFTNAMGQEDWFGTVTLPPGTNVIRAFAVDFAGNIGPVDSVTIRYLSPTNDLFANAVALRGTSGLLNSLNRASTREPGEPLHADNEGGHSIWYKWQSSASGDLTLTTSGSDLDTLLAVYQGGTLQSLIPVASNDDAFPGSLFSQLTLTVSSNQVYYVAIDGFGGVTGNISLQHFFEPVTAGQFFNVTVNSVDGGTVSPPTGVYPANARVTLTAQPDSHHAFAGWEGGFVSTNNPLTFTVTSNLTINPVFKVVLFTDDFETGNLRRLPWVTSANAGWSVQTNTALAGKYSARSAAIGHGETSSLLLSTNTGAGFASFDLRVSSESGWDFVHFYLNGNLLQRWSGETNVTYSFPVPGGVNRLEWRYVKDAHVSSNLDAAFLDNLFLPPDNLNTAAGRLSIVVFTEGPQLTLRGQAGRTYLLESSTDLRNWLPLSSRSSVSGVIHFLDTRPMNTPVRFYRAIAQ
jgi:hypothetical protein